MMVTTLLLVCGAMTISWICDTITESGFGSVLCMLVCMLIVFLITLLIFMDVLIFLLRRQLLKDLNSS